MTEMVQWICHFVQTLHFLGEFIFCVLQYI